MNSIEVLNQARREAEKVIEEAYLEIFTEILILKISHTLSEHFKYHEDDKTEVTP